MMLCVFQVDTQFILHDYFHIVAIGIFDLCKQFVFVAVADRSQVRNAGSNVESVWRNAALAYYSLTAAQWLSGYEGLQKPCVARR